jgi:hypothetical protein
LGYLCAILALVYLGPAQVGGGPNQADYGTNSRAELFERGTYFLRDIPITGGGLNSFPGLYSQYMIVIPSFYFLNSYNMFLDVAIEQGLIAGLAFILAYLGMIWLVSLTIVNTPSRQIRSLSWLGLITLIFTVIHGCFYDYLYNGAGTLLLFFPIGISMTGVFHLENSGYKIISFSKDFSLLSKNYHPILILVPVLVITVLALNINKGISIWYSNLGAVQMSQVELKDFPTNRWASAEIIPRLEMAEDLLHTALQYDPDNQTANHRLGLIAMFQRDFQSAAKFLEKAHQVAPGHRGILKSLGYCYVWLGEAEKAQALLRNIPEARSELDVYVWWWGVEGQPELAQKASEFSSGLNH